ncbi:23S rRNA (guanosine(2251)-2'-O)-methyltransferase RlmB [Chlorobaculum sp. 24CR]|uniref:23S rRNA (guanosine(2251)-2'-O)-methyltransferase RlmB n=1 Tax=Chlorobaculum sp. 24CR TaxID=2508878 RepID=UPI00100A3AF2|nr:23S rRNA (guanosine(2251)-2'-O)-methyltransferase RlmB [Chlorobaculum sp. 24CR]RXK89114.1 23S rRNA (guanosine(2251)-2'-O)-methyltransferase RlmB [Chlorobaculum sp. 24CR]
MDRTDHAEIPAPEPQEQVVYGRNAVIELLQSKPESVEKIYLQFNTNHPKLKEIIITARRLRIPCGKARMEKLSLIAGTAKNQGVCALLTSVTFYTLDEVLAAPRNSSLLLVVLQGLEDPHNVGAIIRTAEAVAADAVIMIDGKGAPISASVHKASAGALSHMRVCKVKSVVKTLDLLRERGFSVVAADMEAEHNHTDFDWTRPTVLVMGAEGSGLGSETRKRCDQIVRIPMAGCVESLNVSVAAGVMLYEAMRQRLG